MVIYTYMDKIEKYIREYVENTGSQGVAIGISGGIDSAVVAALSVKALGKDKVLGLILPCQSQSEDIGDALKVVNMLDIDYKVVDLSKTYQNFLADNKIEEDNTSLVFANIKPRLRMAALYFHSALNSYLVVGTSNKSELITGYCTKYGDSGVDFEPIADLLKKEVYEIAEILKLPESVLGKKPSAGLLLNQDDETELGFTYKELDRYIETGEGQEETIKKILNLYKCSRHKFKIPDQLDLKRNFYLK